MNPETPQPTQTPPSPSETPATPPTPAPETPAPQPTPASFGAGQPSGVAPTAQPDEPAAPAVSQPVPPSAAPAPAEKKGLFITLSILNILFFIPTAIAVFVLYNSHKSAAAAGDTVTAARKLKTMQIVGWIGFAVGFVLFVLYLLSQSVSMAP